MATLTVRVTLSALLGTDPPHPIPQSMSLSLCLRFLLSPTRVGSERCYETGPTKFVLCREDWNAYRTICRYGTRQHIQLINFFKPQVLVRAYRSKVWCSTSWANQSVVKMLCANLPIFLAHFALRHVSRSSKKEWRNSKKSWRNKKTRNRRC